MTYGISSTKYYWLAYSPVSVHCLQINTLKSVWVNSLSSPVPVVNAGCTHEPKDCIHTFLKRDLCVKLKAVSEQSCPGRNHCHCSCRSLRSSGTSGEDEAQPGAAGGLAPLPAGCSMSWSLPQHQRGKQWETGCLDQPEGTVSRGIS